MEQRPRTFTSGRRRNRRGGTSNGGKVDAYLVGGKSWDAYDTRPVMTLTSLKSVLADLSSSIELFLRSLAGTPGELWLVSGLFWRGGH